MVRRNEHELTRIKNDNVITDFSFSDFPSSQILLFRLIKISSRAATFKMERGLISLNLFCSEAHRTMGFNRDGER